MCEWYNHGYSSLSSIPNHCQKTYKREKRAHGLDGEGRNVLSTYENVRVYICINLNTSKTFPMTYALFIK